MAEIYGLTEQAAEQLARDHRKLKQQMQNVTRGATHKTSRHYHAVWLPPQTRQGKADAAISKGAEGVISLWDWNSESEAMEDTTENVTALAWGAAITSGKIVSVWQHAGKWFVAPWGC